jgi:hypothetical protein
MAFWVHGLTNIQPKSSIPIGAKVEISPTFQSIPSYVVPCLLWSGASLRSPAQRLPMLFAHERLLRIASSFWVLLQLCFSAPKSLNMKQRSKFLDTKLCLQCVREIKLLSTLAVQLIRAPNFRGIMWDSFLSVGFKAAKWWVTILENSIWMSSRGICGAEVCRIGCHWACWIRVGNSRAASWRWGDWEDLCVVN